MGLIIPVDEYISLRQVQEKDAAALAKVVRENHDHLKVYFDWARADYDEADAQAFARESLARFEKRQQLQMCIWEDEQIIGGVGWMYWQQSTHDDAYRHPIVSSVDLIYWLAADAEGRGVMVNSVRKLVDFAIGQLKINRVTIRTEPDNVSSIGVAERLGFQCEGEMRDVAKWRDRWVSLRIYSVLAKEWQVDK